MFCACCRNEFSEDAPIRKLFYGVSGSEFTGVTRGLWAPVCEKCYQAVQEIQAAKERGDLEEGEYMVYERALRRALSHGVLVDIFVRNPKLQDAMVRLRVLDY